VAEAKNSSYHGLVGVSLGESCALLGPDRAAVAIQDVAQDGTVRDRVSRMDYRRDPHRAALTAEEAEAELSGP
jgi:hypothetical protein